MIRFIIFAMSVFAAGPAWALSCLAPSVAGAYRFAAESPADYAIAVGALSASGPSNPPEGAVAIGGDINAMAGYTQPAGFDGRFFGGEAFNLPRQVNVTVEVSCVGPWCGSFQNVPYGLFFLRRDADGSYALEARACPGNVFHDPTDADLRQVVTCFQSGC